MIKLQRNFTLWTPTHWQKAHTFPLQSTRWIRTQVNTDNRHFYRSRDTSICHFHNRRAKFLHLLCTMSTVKTQWRVRIWSIKAGKWQKTETIRHWPRVRKKLHSFRKKRNMSCLCFDALFNRHKKRGGEGRKVRKREKGKGASAIRDSVFVFHPPFSQLIRWHQLLMHDQSLVGGFSAWSELNCFVYQKLWSRDAFFK